MLVAELAYESASSLLANTIDRFDRLGLDPPVALMLRLAGAELAAGHLRAARPWFRRAAGVATDPVELAEAAVGLGGIWVHEHRRTVERAAYLALLDRAVRGVESLAVARPDLLVRLRARRAAEHVYTSRWSADRLMVELEAARALGDPLVVAECLSLVHHTMLGPAHAATRGSLADELVAVAAAAGGDLHALLGLMWRTVDFVLSGDSRAVRSLADLVERADALQVAAVSYVADVIGVMNLSATAGSTTPKPRRRPPSRSASRSAMPTPSGTSAPIWSRCAGSSAARRRSCRSPARSLPHRTSSRAT